MKLARLSLVAGLALLNVVASAVAETKLNPYEGIADRNPFGLKPPPPVEPNQTPPVMMSPPATVKVTGVTSILSKKKALLEIVSGPGKPAVKPILSEGERLDTIEVVSIDMDKGEITINNAGTVTNISLNSPARADSAYVAKPDATAEKPLESAKQSALGSVVVIGGD